MNRTLRTVACEECGVSFVTPWTRKRCCDECGVARRSASTAAYHARKTEIKPAALSLIAQQSEKFATGMFEALPGHKPDFQWIVMFRVPFSLAASKNRRWTNNGRSGVFLSREVRSYESAIIQMTKIAMDGRKVKNAKLWIGLFVQKPNNRCDAINVVDTICDAIKKAVDLDDRWFCIERLDWEIKKNDPQIYIRIAQAEIEDMQACSHCGRILALEAFHRSKRVKLGRHRACKDCCRVLDRKAAELKPERAA